MNFWMRKDGRKQERKLNGIVTIHSSALQSAIIQRLSTAIRITAESGWMGGRFITILSHKPALFANGRTAAEIPEIQNPLDSCRWWDYPVVVARVLIQSRPEQLAERLREMVSRRELADPLPPIRAWCRTLGVGHGTLEAALRILRREGVVRVIPRGGSRIVRAKALRAHPERPRVIRWLFFGRDYPDLSHSAEVLGRMRQRLLDQDIDLSFEACDTVRLKAVHRRGPQPKELLVLPSFPRKLQEMFAGFGRNVLLIGPPFPGVELPFISIDVRAAVRDAIRLVAGRGIRGVTLVMREGSRQTVREWMEGLEGETGRRIRGDVAYLPEGLMEQSEAASRLVSRLRAPHALVAVYTISATMLMTALARAGFRTPGEVEVIGVNTTPESVRACPVPVHYPYPLEAFTKAVCRVAARYFEEGGIPRLRKLIPLRVVTPSA